MRRQLVVNGALAALALGTAVAVWATRHAATTGELEARKDKLLRSFHKDDVTRARLTQDGRELELARSQTPGEAGEFRIVKPWPERADIATVNQFLGALELASSLRPADDVPTAEAGLGQQALHIQLETAGKSQTLTLGGTAPAPTGARYAEVTSDGKSRRFVVSQGVTTELSIPFDKFREPRFLEYGRSDISRISTGEGMAHVDLDLAGHGAFFTLANGDRELANPEVIERLLSALSQLSTEHFVDVEQARKDMAPTANVVGLQLVDKSLPPVTLSVGGACPQAPELTLLLREQAGRAARAGCIPAAVAAALVVRPDEVRLSGPLAARPDEIEELRITVGDQKLDLARKDSGFVLRSPGAAEVPLDAGNQRLAALVDARGERVTSPDLAALGLQPAAGELTIQLASGDDTSHRSQTVALGKPRRDGSVCLRRAADHVVLCVPAEPARAFTPDASLLKGLTVLSFAPSELATFSVEARDLKERVRRHEDGSYELEEPKGFSHDGALVADAVQALGTLQAARWVAAADSASFGLAEPRLRVAVTLTTGGATRELVVGAPTEGGYFARLSPDPSVFVLPRSTFSDLAAPLIDRALCPFAKAELALIELKKADGAQSLRARGDGWQATGSSAAHAAELAETLSALRAELTAHVGAARASEGFSNPSLVISFTTTAGKTRRLQLGGRDMLGDASIVYARLDGVDATFALSQHTAEELRDF